MYDLHSHILPGVDDGAKTIEDAVEMARVAANQGTVVVLATPHRKDVTMRFSVSDVEEMVSGMNEQLFARGIDLKVVLGMENHLDLDLPEELLSGRALCINGSRYALVELPFFGEPIYIDEVLFNIQLQGVIPVLAHPERLEVFQRNPDRLAEFVERGMLSQITAGSILGYFGSNVKRLTRHFLKRRVVHVIASDAHFPKGPRSPDLVEGLRAVAGIVGETDARAMVVDTPRSILADLPVDLPAPKQVSGFRRLWDLWGM